MPGRSHRGAVDTFTIGVAREARRTRGVWGHAPQENFAFYLSEIASDAIPGNIAHSDLPRWCDSAAKETQQLIS